jgi:3'-phosphoadenosine 5'-phosphosulfate sulfotransferase (PAPS reductase)/FAD synthetase
VSNPFLIEGPAVISFSGGRTSGYLLNCIVQAHDGKLPEDVRVIFSNTGREMPETLDFVRECGERWGVPITWLEFMDHDEPQKRWREVEYGTASRQGEPFAALIGRKNYLPNPVTRFCTIELKIRPTKLYCQQALGWKEWTMVLGLRADEPRRVAKLSNSTDVFDRSAPLAAAGVSVGHVGDFWAKQPFDLNLPNMNGKTMHGNCDLCFLKGADQILSLVRENPKRAVWWMEQETRIQSSGQAKGDGARFRSDRPAYAAMLQMATNHGELFAFDDEPLQDCMCTE